MQDCEIGPRPLISSGCRDCQPRRNDALDTTATSLEGQYRRLLAAEMPRMIGKEFVAGAMIAAVPVSVG